LLKITTESIGNNRGSVDRIGKGGSHLHSIRKSADFCLEEKSAGLADLVSPKVKRLIEVEMYSVSRIEQGRILLIGSSYQHVFT
jgi:hypothetical protein